MWILLILLLALIVFLASIRPNRATLSEYEIARRLKNHDKGIELESLRQEYYNHLLALKRVKIGAFIILSVIVLFAWKGWLLALMGGLLLMFFYPKLGQMAFVRRYCQKMYDTHELWVLEHVKKLAGFIGLFMTHVPPQDVQLSSREEFTHIVEQSGHILKTDEQKLFASAMAFNTVTVAEVMTPRSVIDSVSVSELLGPLVLNDLHKTGHSRFPVTDGDIDHVVGILHIQDLLTVHGNKTSKVKDVMDAKVHYIKETQTLEHALSAFIKSKRHLFVVVNDYRETVGLLSLEDVMEKLLGRKIVDQFDAHDDLRAVAERNPRENNKPPQALDV